MLSVLVGAVVVAEEVLATVQKSELVSTGDKDIVGCHPWHEGAGVGCYHGGNRHRGLS